MRECILAYLNQQRILISRPPANPVGHIRLNLHDILPVVHDLRPVSATPHMGCHRTPLLAKLGNAFPDLVLFLLGEAAMPRDPLLHGLVVHQAFNGWPPGAQIPGNVLPLQKQQTSLLLELRGTGLLPKQHILGISRQQRQTCGQQGHGADSVQCNMQIPLVLKACPVALAVPCVPVTASYLNQQALGANMCMRVAWPNLVRSEAG